MKGLDYQLNEQIINCQWNAYVYVNERRRRNSYLLFSLCIAFIPLIFAQNTNPLPSTIELPYIGEFEYFSAMLVAMILLSFTTVSNHYLSCHSIRSYFRWMLSFMSHNYVELRSLKLGTEGVHTNFKNRDVTDIFNVFNIWTLKAIRKDVMRSPLSILQNIVSVSLGMIALLIPMCINMLIFIWLFRNVSGNISERYVALIISLLSILAILPVVSSFFFNKRMASLVNKVSAYRKFAYLFDEEERSTLGEESRARRSKISN